MKGYFFLGMLCLGCSMFIACNKPSEQPATESFYESQSQSLADSESVPSSVGSQSDVVYNEISIEMTEHDGAYSVENIDIPGQTVCYLYHDDDSGWGSTSADEVSFNYTLQHGTNPEEIEIEISFGGKEEELPYTQIDKTSGFLSFIGETDTQRYVYIKNTTDTSATIAVCELTEK